MIYNEDAIKWAKNYEGERFHALLTDAPYHLTTITKRFGKNSSAPAKFGKDGAFQRTSKGFMGQTWDGGDVAFDPETWASFLPLLHPGAFGMAFSASRNWHRLAVAIEDAGFIIHPSIFGWCYGSGFPKATRVNMRAQEDPEEIFTFDVTHAFLGHRYGLQALKPALEPIIVFQKPYDGRPIDNIALTGAGVLNIDGARIVYEDGGNLATNPSLRTYINGGNGGHIISHEDDRRVVIPNKQGRWPANFYLDAEAARRLDEQSGIKKGGFVRNRTDGARVFNNNGKKTGYTTEEKIEEDPGGASRFFFQVQQQVDEADPVRYIAKVSKKERNAGLNEILIQKPHPTVKPIALAEYLATLLLPPAEYAPRRLFVPFSGVASEMIGGCLAGWEEVVGVEITKEYIPIAEARIEYWTNKK